MDLGTVAGAAAVPHIGIMPAGCDSFGRPADGQQAMSAVAGAAASLERRLPGPAPRSSRSPWGTSSGEAVLPAGRVGRGSRRGRQHGSMSADDTKLAVGVEPGDRQRRRGVAHPEAARRVRVPDEQHPAVAAEVGDLHEAPLPLVVGGRHQDAAPGHVAVGRRDRRSPPRPRRRPAACVGRGRRGSSSPAPAAAGASPDRCRQVVERHRRRRRPPSRRGRAADAAPRRRRGPLVVVAAARGPERRARTASAAAAAPAQRGRRSGDVAGRWTTSPAHPATAGPPRRPGRTDARRVSRSGRGAVQAQRLGHLGRQVVASRRRPGTGGRARRRRRPASASTAASPRSA